MSQPVKRNAEEAFSGQQSELHHKRRRRKGRKSAPKNEVEYADDGLPITQPTSSDAQRSQLTEVELSPAVEERQEQSKDYQAIKEQTSTDDVSTIPQTGPDGQDGTPQTTKKHKKQKRNKSTVPPSQDLVVSHPIAEEKAVVHKSKASVRKHTKKPAKTSWTISGRRGGIFVNIDPLMTDDNKHLILPTKYDVHIYSTATSLLVRSIHVSERADIRSCTISAANSEHIFVGMRNGSVTRYDWTTGHKLSQYKVKPGIVHLTSAGVAGDHENFFAIVSQGDSDSELLQVSINLKTSEKTVTSMLQMEYIQPRICFSNDLSTLIVFGKDTIHLGRAVEQAQPMFVKLQYKWDIVGTKGRIVSCDARVVSQPTKSKQLHGVDVAVGLQNGAILVYNNLLNNLHGKSEAVQVNSIVGRRLHWHRTSVRALKWSRDGNYLISGGDESVLVIWQLDTNQKQFLPHLATSILNIAISKSGAHYALRLGDNSVMILSTADLAPSTNIVGLAVSGGNATQTTALHPLKRSLLLSATSVRSVGARATSEATHLQSYDIDTNLQIGRQALTRNFITAVNVAPNGQPLHEPNITHLCLSSDGKWLATVDEWSPNEVDTGSMRLKQDTKSAMRECTLRIWGWKNDDNSWNPTIKIDNPHPGEGTSILAMTANPARHEFATLASDGCVRMWTPKTRIRDGLAVKDGEGTTLYNWSCSHVTSITDTDGDTGVHQGALAWSEDGSVLAASWSSASTTSYVHLIDAKSGHIVLSQPNLVTGKPIQMCFGGRFLVVLSDVLTIFDTITLQVTFNLIIGPEYLGTSSQKNKLLAVNPLTNTIALSLSCVEQQKPRTSISIFDLNRSDVGPIAEINLSNLIRSLLADPATRGFMAIDAEAGLLRLTPDASSTHTSTALVPHSSVMLVEQDGLKGMEEIFGKETVTQSVGSDEQKLLLNSQQSSTQSLDELLRRSASGVQMGVNDLFEKVARAVSGIRLTT